MSDMASAVYDFHRLPAELQQDVIDTCVSNGLLTWPTILEKVQDEIVAPEFVINLINFHKHNSTAPTVPERPVWEGNKRTKTDPKVTPEPFKQAASPTHNDAKANRALEFTEQYAAFFKENGVFMRPFLENTHPAKKVPSNNNEGNKTQYTAWANEHLACPREDNWICTEAAGSSSFYKNPKKAVITLLNWH